MQQQIIRLSGKVSQVMRFVELMAKAHPTKTLKDLGGE